MSEKQKQSDLSDGEKVSRAANLYTHINDVLDAAYEDGRWAEAWDATAGQFAETPEPPALDRY